MLKNIFFIAMLLLSGCSSNWNYKEAEHVIIAEDVIAKSSNKLARKYEMYSFGSGGRMMTRVNSMLIAFQVFRPLTHDEARDLIVNCAIEFLEDINSNEMIRPYLVQYPFTFDHVEVEIYSVDKDNSRLYDPFVSVVYTYKGKITYTTDSPLKKFGHENVYKETFEEALGKLNRSYMPST